MLKTRVIPCLLLKNGGLVKTIKFRDPVYIGDPINAVKIFNEKEVDELVILDIRASVEGRKPDLKMISELASECFMPLGYGGGIRDIQELKQILALGVEKVVINSHAVERPSFVTAAADAVGSQSVVVSIDVKKNLFGKYQVFTDSGKRNEGIDPVEFACKMQQMGAGELFLNSIDRDGTMLGYDISLIKRVSLAVDIPVVACGGAGRLEDFAAAAKIGGASALSAGSFFVFQGVHRAVLISYPSIVELERVLQ